MQRKSSGYRVIVVANNPSKPELEAIIELLDISLQVNDVDLVISSEVLDRIKSTLSQYQWENETRTKVWNHCVVNKVILGISDEEPCYDRDLIEDEDRIIQGD